MSGSLRLYVIIVGIVLFIITAGILKKGRIPVKYSFVWFLASIIIIFIGLIPGVLSFFSNALGFEAPANMIIGVFIFTLLLITMALTIIVSGQKKKTTLLIQEISILEERVEKLEKKK